MTWSNLETNFQEGEATQALITRAVINDNKVGKVGANVDDKKDSPSAPPRVVTAASGESLALVIDHDLHIFGAKGKETEFSLHLNTPVVALTWVEVSNLILNSV